MSALAPLRHPAFRLLVAGRTATTAGNAIAPVALAFAVLDLTGSARDLGLVVGVRSLVNVLFLLVGGVLADRLPRHLVMVGASLLAAGTQAAVATAVLTGAATVPLLLGLSSVNGLAAALALPAAAAILPQTVPAAELQQANAVGRLFLNGAMIVGASAGGVLVAAVGPGWGLAADAVTFLLAALCFALVRVPAAGRPRGSTVLLDLREGWAEFTGRTWLWVVVAAFCLVNAVLSGSVNVLGPVIADATIGRPAWGFVLAAETCGMVAGALVAMRLRVRRLLRFGVLSSAGIVVLLLAMGLAPVVGVLLAAAFVTGAAIEVFTVSWDTTMQEHVPADRLARVYSYDMVGSYLALPVGQIVAGPVAEAVGVRTTLLGAAALTGLAVAAMLSSRDVRHLEHRRAEPAAAAMEDLPT